jgi:rubrerythrin
MHELPEGAPATLNEAFAKIAVLPSPSVEDLKVMVLVEAAGKRLYDDLATNVESEGVKALLHRNGREELAHAHRMSRAIGKLTGADYPVPEPEENPYITTEAPPPRAVDRAFLAGLATAEFGGEDLYERWASNCDNAEVAALMRQNGREEREHGNRLHEAAELLGAG